MPVDAFDVSHQSSWSIGDKAGLTQAFAVLSPSVSEFEL